MKRYGISEPDAQTSFRGETSGLDDFQHDRFSADTFAAYVVFLQTFWGRVGLSRSDTLNCLAWFSCLLLDFLRHQSDT